jgi:hypothetical protein
MDWQCIYVSVTGHIPQGLAPLFQRPFFLWDRCPRRDLSGVSRPPCPLDGSLPVPRVGEPWPINHLIDRLVFTVRHLAPSADF